MPSYLNKNNFDVIVIGVGSMGAAACYSLAQQGLKVLGLERFSISHENGSHGGQSRLIRQSYFEHPNYVPLLKEAYKGWETLENESDTQLYYETGILYSGLAEQSIVSGTVNSANIHHLDLEHLEPQAAHQQFPQFNLPSHYKTVFEPGAGFITPELAIRTFASEAEKQGAVIHSKEKTLSWSADGDGVSVKTEKRTYTAKKLIITSGAWTSNFLPFLKPDLIVTKQILIWVNTYKNDLYNLSKMPSWIIQQENMSGAFYGFPILNPEQFGGPSGLKIGFHYPAETIDPDANDRSVDQIEIDLLTNFFEEFMPGSFKSVNSIKTCLYTSSPDEDFIIDIHPDHNNVVFAGGFSGHGFKFAPVIGKALSELTIKGSTDLPIDFLSLDRLK